MTLGIAPELILYNALIPALEEVGRLFELGEYFVPEMLMSAQAMQGSMEILAPLIAETGAKPVGKFVMGTVKGDIHDIGKNLCNVMLEGGGFEVIDLGVNVPVERFVEAVREHKPDFLGMSAFLTTTMPMFKPTIEALEAAGLRDDLHIFVGGAPVTEEFAAQGRGRRIRVEWEFAESNVQGDSSGQEVAAILVAALVIRGQVFRYSGQYSSIRLRIIDFNSAVVLRTNSRFFQMRGDHNAIMRLLPLIVIQSQCHKISDIVDQKCPAFLHGKSQLLLIR